MLRNVIIALSLVSAVIAEHRAIKPIEEEHALSTAAREEISRNYQRSMQGFVTHLKNSKVMLTKMKAMEEQLPQELRPDPTAEAHLTMLLKDEPEGTKREHWLAMNGMAQTGDLTNPTDHGINALHLAAKYGHLDVIKAYCERAGVDKMALLNAQADSPPGATAMYFAVMYGHTDVVKYLKDNDADVNIALTSGRTIFHAAAHSGHKSVFTMMNGDEHLFNSDKPDKEGMTPLMIAAQEGKANIIQYFITARRQVDFKQVDVWGRTVFHYAAKFGHDDVLTYLKSHWHTQQKEMKDLVETFNAGEDHEAAIKNTEKILGPEFMALLDMKDRLGNTALHLAAQRAFEETIRLLFDWGARIDLKNNENSLPLHLAVANTLGDNKRMVEFMIEKTMLSEKELINAVDKNGNTPAHLAYKAKKLDYTQLFKQITGVKLDIKNKDGKTINDFVIAAGGAAVVGSTDDNLGSAFPAFFASEVIISISVAIVIISALIM